MKRAVFCSPFFVMTVHKEIILPHFPRGIHLITDIVIKELTHFPSENGLLHLFLPHTSAAITINESYDPDVRTDFENFLNALVPENTSYFLHTLEGPDDMPAHIKAALIGNSCTIPVQNGKLLLGTWQGIYFCELRNHPSKRKLILSLTS